MNEKTAKIKVPEDDLGFRIKRAREDKKLTQEALSILTKYPEIDPEEKGLSRPTIVGYEQGKNLPDARGIRLLAMALDVTPSWIVTGKYDNPSDSYPDPRKGLIEALDRYTARRHLELSQPLPKEVLDALKEENPFAFLDHIRRSTPVELVEVDSLLREGLEHKARGEALAKNQKIHKQRGE